MKIFKFCNLEIERLVNKVARSDSLATLMMRAYWMRSPLDNLEDTYCVKIVLRFFGVGSGGSNNQGFFLGVPEKVDRESKKVVC